MGRKADEKSPEALAVRPCGMEARDEPQHRTRVNPCAGGFGLGECARQHDARYPTATESVVGAAAAGPWPSLPQEISTGPRPGFGRVGGSAGGGNDAARRPWRSRITPYVALRPGNAGGAKGVTG